MMAGLFLVLSAVALLVLGVLGALTVVLLRESRKLDGAADLSKKIAATAADIAALRKEHNALDELVLQKMNRIATTRKRDAKKEEEEESSGPKLPLDLEFPSLVKGGA